MKKSLFFVPLFMAAFASCTNEDTVSEPVAETGTSFLSVNLVNTPSMGTRATEDADNYEDGTATENNVSSIRFYFFDKDKKAVNVKGNGTLSYLDLPSADGSTIEPGAGSSPNVEKTINATLVIETPKGDNIPTSIIAVLNPTENLKKADITSIDDLNKQVEAYSKDGGFVMSNSVYAKGAGENVSKMEEVSVAGHLYENRETALSNPVDIYVERVLAKVRVHNGLTPVEGKDGIYSTGVDKYNNAYTYNGKTIYVKFLGWNVTATADKSRLMKEINPKWADNLFGSEAWNYSPYFRSFWAVNPTGVEYNYFAFNKGEDEKGANCLSLVSGTDKTAYSYTYVQENAAKDYTTGANADTPTQVIIAAQLVDENGNAMEFAEWAGIKYSIEDLKTAMLAQSNLYRRVVVGTDTKYEPITVDDVELKTATAADYVPETGTPRRYRTYLKLIEGKESETWTSGNEEGASTVNANTVLQNLGSAKVWKSGYTYYYFPIQHLAAENTGAYGVVRNHLYDANITTLAGLGTPVYDPTETIYPEKPEVDETYIAAKINILSWRLVKQNISLDWK